MMKSKGERTKNGISHYEELENKAYQILATIEELHKIRLVEKIARPIPFSQKEQIFIAYKNKFLHLHLMLEQLQKEYSKENDSGIQHRGTNSTLGAKQRIQSQDIRKIESAYNEVLVQGSFKHFQVVAKVAGVPLSLERINIQAWATACLQEEPKSCSSCCC